jgi:hypothetical protein
MHICLCGETGQNISLVLVLVDLVGLKEGILRRKSFSVIFHLNVYTWESLLTNETIYLSSKQIQRKEWTDFNSL